MSEIEPTVPYDSVSIHDWCNTHGINYDDYTNLYRNDFRIARLRSKELSLEAQLRFDVQQSLPLQGSSMVEDPRLRPESWRTQPKVYLAPEGMAFQIEAEVEMYEYDKYGDIVKSSTPTVETSTFVGEFLDIETRVYGDEADAFIVVRERPQRYAVPILNDGNPDKGNSIRLPSRANPEKDGAHVTFARLDGWQVARSPSKKMSAHYLDARVTLVPFEREPETELYVANFERYNDFKLDDFIFVDEMLELPGFMYVRRPGGSHDMVRNATGSLILPSISSDEAHELEVNHGLRVNWNKTTHEHPSVRLNIGTQGADFALKKFNSGQETGKTFHRWLAIHYDIGKTSLKDVIAFATSKEKLTDEEFKKFG